MSASRIERDLYFGFRAVMVLLLLLGLTAGSASGGTFDGVEPFVVSAAAFNLDGFSSTNYAYSFNGWLYQVGSSPTCFMAPLYLPEGLSVESMVLHAWDVHASDVVVRLVRSNLFDTAGYQTMGLVSTSGASGMQNPVDDSIVWPVIDNRFYNYRLQTCLEGDAGTALLISAVTLYSSFFRDGFESGNTLGWSSTVQ